MGNFNTSLAITMGNEGGYNHGVGENETFFGIDRGYNPNWSGWLSIDKIKSANPGKNDSELNVIFRANIGLMQLKNAFYKGNYWNTLQLDSINDQQVCNILFDDNVNPCEITAAHVMQQACVDNGAKIAIDGQVGPNTVGAVNSINGETYYNSVIVIRRGHYENEVITHPAQRQWLKVWLSRLVAYKTVA